MNGFGHIGIPTCNIKKSRKFFGKVFGWTFQQPEDLDVVLFRAGTRPNGSLFKVKKMPRKGQVNAYIEVEDITATLKAVKKAKGKVLVKKSKVGAMGWSAQFATPDGCVLSLWQSAPATEAATPEANQA